FVIWGVVSPASLTRRMEEAQSFFLVNFGWLYHLCATIFLLFALFLMFSQYGKISLGKVDDKPDTKYTASLAMLFRAGMRTGLVFFGVGEPISHFAHPPLGEPYTSDAAKRALRYTYLHWGLHAWAIYATIALALAYYKFRKGYPGLMSAALYPILGERVKGR